MAINTSKTKFILFRTQGKKVDDQICNIVFNNNEIGKIQDPSLIFPIERIHNHGVTKVFKLLGILLDEYLSFTSKYLMRGLYYKTFYGRNLRIFVIS